MSKAFKEAGSFFAFSDKQFKEQAKKGIKYINLEMGLICPKDKAKELIKTINKITENGIKQDIKENGITNIIKRELYNHEATYTGSIEDTAEALKGYKIQNSQISKILNTLQTN